MSSDEENGVEKGLARIFLIGYIHKNEGNLSLNSIANDLQSNYYVARNSIKGATNRSLIQNASLVIFLITHETLADRNCLLWLQTAWHLRKPVMILRPPNSKLVISDGNKTKKEAINKISPGTIKSPKPEASPGNRLDFNLLQEVIEFGYNYSTVYDCQEHSKSMGKLKKRLTQVLSEKKPRFFLSPAFNKNPEEMQFRRLRSPPPEQPATPTNSEQPPPDDDEQEIDEDKFECSPLTPITPSGVFFPSSSRRARLGQQHSSLSSGVSFERRLSLSCLDDAANYQRTQYLVFPMRDSSKQPYVLRFPDDMRDEEERTNGSIWGSDTSLEDEYKLASQITAGISIDVDEDEDSVIHSPPPLLGDLE